LLLRESTEVKTLSLISLTYAIWGILLFGPELLPVWLTIIFIVPLIAFHSSLQHECIHGHPFTDIRLNDLIAYAPLGIFLPYSRYKENHLIHHQKASISDPAEDPESWYLTPDQWQRSPRWLKAVFNINCALTGRLLLGPALGMVALIVADAKKIKAGELRLARIWAIHFLFCIGILMAIAHYGSISVTAYLLCAYFGMSILMIRTYLEHQAHQDMRGRSVLIEDKGPLRFLFLNNNLHAVHHAYPALAWYRLPGFFAQNRARFLQMNKGYSYRSYAEIFRKFALARKEPVVFPLKAQ